DGAREGADRAGGRAHGAVSVLHRRIHDRVPAERVGPRADDRGGARGLRDPRRRVARARNADEGARREGGDVTSTLASRRAPLANPVEQLATLDASMIGRKTFEEALHGAGWGALKPVTLEIFQINRG